MPHITGKLTNVVTKVEQGTVEVMLCGYGSSVPRVQGFGLIARLTDSMDIAVAADGTFIFDTFPNDDIEPAGTYYTITIKDSNGDTAQVNAYQFLGAVPSYDLDSTAPYDPNQPLPPLPVLLYSLLVVLAPADDMVFDGGGTFTAFQTTLPGDVTAPVFQNMVPGNIYTFIIIQDVTGGHKFEWASNVFNAMLVDPAPTSISIQSFMADSFGNLEAIGPGTYYP